MQPAATLQRTDFADLGGWAADTFVDALRAFQRSALHAKTKAYRTGSLGLGPADFAEAYQSALALNDADEEAARRFFETNFVPFRIRPGEGEDGFVTGYFEPIVEASRHRTDVFCYPLLRRPDDLIDLDDTNRPADLDPQFMFGRQTDSGIVAYHDRGEIETGALAGRGLEMAWLADEFETFLIHVQGAARLQFPDGEQRVTYAAKSGHPFTGPGKVLVDMGVLQRETVDLNGIRTAIRRFGKERSRILRHNRSYIFFREAEVDDPELGPIAAAKVPLTPGRSLAVDRLIHTFGTPFFIHAPKLTQVDSQPFARLMIAQDTGSAIVGPARGDLFIGSGEAAGEIAGVIKQQAAFTILVPKLAAERFG
ncbi:MltA domain-containing protein [Tianweitania sp. BSSL-BM11]|uniref:peptidoglycan lytic exotransglycosylase n=1 Tax=Tianweitania aestuarii TaxID=2814886 RepID=A0ABS5RX89_9HYPH|nr:MltA domain-containing protein [Tianweitania aestuarii]MBS9721646.1 MltA domain-containing protein [Tianweitania aestuarii]